MQVKEYDEIVSITHQVSQSIKTQSIHTTTIMVYHYNSLLVKLVGHDFTTRSLTTSILQILNDICFLFSLNENVAKH